MSNCFNIQKCHATGFKIYIYPYIGLEASGPVSDIYQNIIDAAKRSRYYTENEAEACLKVLYIDTIDRDKLSARYVTEIEEKIWQTPGWNHGENHVIFCIYSGTWPDYDEEIDFRIGKAILAKSSISDVKYRSGFDISLPLWQIDHPKRGQHTASLPIGTWPSQLKYLVTFKGKRYVHGIGSDVRNKLHYLHDGESIIMLTTCRHGSNWEQLCPSTQCIEKCTIDNTEYDKWDYTELLQNSTFCLVPRGRRLGSYRFIEVLQQGCIPIVMANGWMLPFAEAIDWSQAAINLDERMLLELTENLRSISPEDIMKMRQQGAFLYSKYFSSIDQIVQTVFEILHDRVFFQDKRSHQMWNLPPGALAVTPSQTLSSVPFYFNTKMTNFTVVIHAVQSVTSSKSALVRTMKNLWLSTGCGQIVIIVACMCTIHEGYFPLPPEGSSKVLTIEYEDDPKLSNRFRPRDAIIWDAVLFLKDDVYIGFQEVDFGFNVWNTFPTQLVGYVTMGHEQDEETMKTGLKSGISSEFSMIDGSALWIHKYYLNLFIGSRKSIEHVNSIGECEDILLNFIVSDITGLPPIKATHHTWLHADYDELSTKGSLYRSPLEMDKQIVVRSECIDQFIIYFGHNPLRNSAIRMDPMLFKDNIDMDKKRYKKIEASDP